MTIRITKFNNVSYTDLIDDVLQTKYLTLPYYRDSLYYFIVVVDD